MANGKLNTGISVVLCGYPKSVVMRLFFWLMEDKKEGFF